MRGGRSIGVRFAMLLVGLGLLQVSCQPTAVPPPRPTETATSRTRPLYPAFRVREGTGPSDLPIERAELPISLTIADERRSTWIVLFQFQGRLDWIQIPPATDTRPPLALVESTASAESVIHIVIEGDWRLFQSYLGPGNFMDVPDRLGGTGNHIVFFTSGTPMYVNVEADPSGGVFSMHAIDNAPTSDTIVASAARIEGSFPLRSDTLGLQIRAQGPWSTNVVDRPDLLD
jgi:hypothetical protein